MEIPEPKHHAHELFETDYSNEWAEEHFRLYFTNSKVIDHGYWLCECGYDKFDVLYYDGRLRNVVIENEKITKRKEYSSPRAAVVREILTRGCGIGFLSTLGLELGKYYANEKSEYALLASLFLFGISLTETIKSSEIDNIYREHREVWDKFKKTNF